MDRFSFPCDPAPLGGVLKNDKLRITVLTSCMLRLETGSYTDQPTQTVWNRNFPKVSYRTEKSGNLFSVITEDVTFCIDLKKRKMQSIILADGTVVTDFHKGNLLGTARTLDMVNGATKLEMGILSRSGVAVMDDSKRLILNSDGTISTRENCTDLYFFAYGHDYSRCLKDFFHLTGPVPMIPKYALGNWWSRYYAYTQADYQKLMETFIQRKLPITVATIDMDWHWTDVYERFGREAEPGKPTTRQEIFYNHKLPGWTGYSWNTELFPDYKALLRWLKENGFHITLNVHPSQGIRYYEDCYKAVCERMGVDPNSKERIPFRIADRRFLEAYLDEAHHPYEEAGVDFWWLDWQQGKNSGIPGLDPLWALNHYHTLDNGRDGKRPMILSRYSGLGSHRYPLGFSGDTFATWKSLDFQPYFTATAANAGYSWWSHDIGGHQFGDQDDELYLRWLQFGVYSPINRLHSSNSEFMGKEPWKRSCTVCRIAEEFLRLRHRLIPYLYTANYRTHVDGTPICMPMYYAWDQDEAYEAKSQYLFGGSLLVCPITKPVEKHLNLACAKVWLPEGRWTDFFTDQIYRGGQWVDMHRDLDAIPVLAAPGTIVPMYQNGDSNDLSLEQPLEIHIWRGNGEYTLYEDDGISVNSPSSLTRFTVREDENQIQFVIEPDQSDFLPATRQMNLVFRDLVSGSVTVNGVPVQTDDQRLCVPVIVGREAVHIEVTDFQVLRNLTKKELKTNLLTRLQWNNYRKSKTLQTGITDRIPAYLKKALSELNTLE